MKPQEVQDIVDAISFRDWDIIVKDDYLQVRFMAPDVNTGRLELQACRKWRLSEHMTESEIVGTAMKAILAAVEHEAREDFLYEGIRVFNPHIDIKSLMQVATQVEVRA